MIYEFAATQDLHGYAKPWAPGEGKNRININGEVIAEQHDPADAIPFEPGDVINGFSKDGYQRPNNVTFAVDGDNVTITSLGAGYGIGYVVAVTPGDIYTFSHADSGRVSVSYFDSDKIVTSYEAYVSGNMTVTIPEDAAYAAFILVPNELNTAVTYQKPMAELGSSATSYAPYANICPPEGFNIWDPVNAEYIQVYAGYVNANTRELYLRPVYKEYAGEELVGPWMSSLDPYEEDTTPTEGAFVIDFGGELESFEITPFMLQTLLDSLGIRQHFTNGAGLLNSLMDQAQGRVRSEEELLHLSRPLKVIAIGDQLPAGITFKPISKDVLPGLPGKFIR